jgi:sugar O-acyltransferase (sialic acid O-acetyltransferase NeuD family)
MYLFGASGHGKVVADIIESSEKEMVLEMVYDDNPKLESILNTSVLKVNDEILNSESNQWIISIGNNKFRKLVSERIKGSFLKAIHKSAVISKHSSIGQGTVVMANAVINPDSIVGEHCIINTGAVVEHDCKLDNYVHISPNASLAGGVLVGEGSHIGIGATIIQGITIGKWCTIGAGAVIIQDVPDYAVVVGNPGRIIKSNSL